MSLLEPREIFLWIAIIAIVALAAVSGMLLNRFFIYRAHRRALDDLRRRILEENNFRTESTVACRVIHTDRD